MLKKMTDRFNIQTHKPWRSVWRGLLLLVSLLILNPALTTSAFMDSAPDWASSALAPTYPGVANGLELRQSLQFTDLGQHWAKDSIIRVAAQGLMRGYGNHRFQPNQALTRQEVITGLIQALGREAEALAVAETGTQNLGAIRADSWAAGFLQAAISAEIITANELNATDWRETATREELAMWIGRAVQLQPIYGAERRAIYSFRDANAIELAAAPWVEAVLRENLMYGTQTNLFDPKGPMTRAQLAVMFDRLSPRLNPVRGVTEHWGIVEDKAQNQAYIQGTPVQQLQFKLGGRDPLVARLVFQAPVGAVSASSQVVWQEAAVYRPQTSQLGNSELIQVGDNLRYLTDKNAQVFYIEVTRPQTEQTTLQGQLQQIDPVAGQLTVLQADGTLNQLPLNQQVTVEVNEQPASLEDLMTGQEATIVLGQGRVVTIQARLSQPNPGYLPADRQVHFGRVREIAQRTGPTGRTETVLLLVENGQEIDYLLTPYTTYSKDNQLIRLEQVRPGDRVHLYLEEDHTPAIVRPGQASPDPRRVARVVLEGREPLVVTLYRGQLESLAAIPGQLSLRDGTRYYQGNWQNTQPLVRLEIGSDTQIFQDGRLVTLAEIQRPEYRGYRVYAAVRDNYGGQRVVHLILDSGYNNQYYNQIKQINYATRQLTVAGRDIQWDDATLVLHNGRLLDPFDLKTGQDVQVITNYFSSTFESGHRATVIIVEQVESSYLRFLRGKIDDIRRDILELWDCYEWRNQERKDISSEDLRFNLDTRILDSRDQINPGVALTRDELAEKWLEALDVGTDEDMLLYLIADQEQILAINLREDKAFGVREWISTGTISSLNPTTGMVTLAQYKDWDNLNDRWNLNQSSRTIDLKRAQIVRQGRPVPISNLRVGDQLYWLEDITGPILVIVE
ncbi:MAG: S-layer homology domain-containing protein [Bacillota bacterium]|jgi:hypothetical protein